MIYFLQSGDNGPIKIGHTKANVATRVSALQAISPYELIFLGYHGGDLRTERRLHEKFSTHRFRGEWFNPVPVLLDYIDKNAMQGDIRKLLHHDLRDAVSRRVRKHWPKGAKEAFRKEFRNYGQPHFHDFFQWSSEGATPNPKMIKAIDRFMSDWGLPNRVPQEWDWRIAA